MKGLEHITGSQYYMNKIVLIAVGILAIVFAAVSFGIKNMILERSDLLVKKTATQNENALLQLADTYRQRKDLLKTQKILKGYMKRFPDAEKNAQIAKEIEELNMKILFSSMMTEDSIFYEIKPGDTLAEIASRYNTTVELLKKANGLTTSLIMPGKQLKVYKGGFTISVDKSKNVLFLKKKNGEIFKTYAVSTGKDYCTPTGTFTIEEKLVSPVWYKVDAVVEPNSPEYELGSRWMGISEPGYGIHGTKDESSIGQYITSGCVRMKNEDVEELYTIVPSGTSVTIIE